MSIIVNDSIKVSKTNTPTRDGERISSLAQMSSIATPFVGMRVYVENTGKEYVVTGLAKARINGVTVENAVVDTYVEVAYQSGVDELQSTLEGVEANLAGAIEAESTRAQAAESGLSNKIQQEKSEILNSLEAVEESLANNIATEEERATAAESELKNNIISTRNEAKSDLEAVESNLAQAIAAEEERATAAEQMLHESLLAESAANIDAFALVQSRHDEFVLEVNQRFAALLSTIKAEVERAQGRESQLAADIVAEKERAEAAEQQLRELIGSGGGGTPDDEEPDSPYITFADAEVERICIENFDT